MSDLKTAFGVLERRGETAGGETIAARAMADVAAAAPPEHRRSKRLAVVGLVAAVALIAGVTYVRSEARSIRRIDVTAALGGRPAAAYGPMNIVIIGSDSPANERADLIMVARLDPSTGRAAIVSIPRDLWVPVPSSDHDDRLSNVLNRGPGALIAALRQRLGIDIDHFVQVDLDGFREMVRIVGGVKMPFAAPTRDVLSGLDVPAGCVKLNGDQALAFVRSRHMQTLEAGQWHTDPTGDLGRIQRQQFLLRQLLVLSGPHGVRTAFTDGRLLKTLGDHAVVDSGLSTAMLMRLARDFHDIAPEALTMLTLPTTVASIDGASVLQVDESTAGPVLAVFSVDDTAPVAHDPTTAPTHQSGTLPGCR
jgi:LCP family protein required for cell wall assembly